MKEHPDDHLAGKFDGMDALDKVEWMIESTGWALEAVPAELDAEPPTPGYSYSIGLRLAVGFTDVAVFGLTPVAAKGLLTLVADACRGGTEIPVGVEVVGLLDNELRCMFAPVDVDRWGSYFEVGAAWSGGEPFEVVQLLYPDPNGFMPYEAGFDHRMSFAQPVIATL